MRPGHIFFGEGEIICNRGRRTLKLKVHNSSDHTIFVSSHYHFFEANRRLVFNREAAYGMRLDIPAGDSVTWEPGETKEVRLVELAGAREVYGFNGLVNGVISDSHRSMAVDRSREKGFQTGAKA